MTLTRQSASARLLHIASAVRAHAPVMAARDGNYFEAAVAIILRETRDDDVEMLFIERAARSDDPWSGQIAFPGGRYDRTDESLEDTAVRETREEVGLELHRDGIVIGSIDEFRPRIQVLPPVIVRPFVATISPEATPGVSDEVAGYFWTSLDEVFNPANTRETELHVRQMQMTRPAIHIGGHVIWGMTESILRKFAEIVR